MEKIKIYIDEDLTDRLAVALIRVRSSEKKTLNSQLLTPNREYYKKGLSHNGIVVTDFLLLKELIRRITKFLNERSPVEIKNHLDWLQNYK